MSAKRPTGLAMTVNARTYAPHPQGFAIGEVQVWAITASDRTTLAVKAVMKTPPRPPRERATDVVLAQA